MQRIARFIFAFFFIILASPLPALGADAFSVSATVEKQTVFTGESLVFQIQVQGHDSPEKPELSHVSDFHVQFLGGRQNNRSSITIINGKMTKEVQHGYVFSYRLTPKRIGNLKIPPIEVAAGGETDLTRALTIQAKKPAEVEDFKFELQLSENKCYVGQPVKLTGIWYIGREVKDFVVNLPVLDDGRFEIADWDMPVDQSKRGRYLQVPLGGEKTIGIKERRQLDGKEYLAVRFEKILIPNQPGTFSLPESTVSFLAVTGYRKPRANSAMDDFFSGGFLNNFRQAVTKQFVIPSNTPELIVRGLPEAGRPADFNGLVGSYSIAAEASPTKVKVGDPITLTLRVKGPDYLDSVKLPALEKQAALAENFKIPSDMAPGTIKNGAKVFTQTVRAKTADVEEIPPIEIPYFDVGTGAYQVARSDPVPLDVEAARIVTARDAEGNPGRSGRGQSELETWGQGIAYNYEDLSVLSDQSAGLDKWHRSPLWLAWLVGLPFVYAAAFLVMSHWRRHLADPEVKRRQKAYSCLKSELKNLETFGVDAEKTVSVDVLDALRRYLAKKLRLTPGALTSNEIEAALRRHQVEEQVIENLKELFKTGEAIQYGGLDSTAESPASIVERAMQLARTLERSLP